MERKEKRGAKPGERRGGRPKGAPNKRTAMYESVREACEAAGYNPAETLVEIARNKKNESSIRGRAAAELCSYLYPKKRSVEVSGVGGGPVSHDHSFSKHESAVERIASEIARLTSQGATEGDTPITQ